MKEKEKEREKEEEKTGQRLCARVSSRFASEETEKRSAQKRGLSLSLLSPFFSRSARSNFSQRERVQRLSPRQRRRMRPELPNERERENTQKKNRGVSFESALVVVVSRDALASSFERISFHFESSPFASRGKKDAISLSLMLRYLVVVLVAEDKCGRAEEQEEQRRQPRRDDFVLLHLRSFCFLRARV